MKDTTLTPRQWNVYVFLREYFVENPNTYVSKETLVNNFKLSFNLNPNQEEHNSTAYANLRKDIRAINECATIQKIIVSNRNGYKIANEKEAIAYYQKRRRDALKILCRVNDVKTRIKNNGQMRFVEDDSKARQVIETFMEI